MTTYVVLMRGINVGGANKLSMAALKAWLGDLGYANVSTYIASGNVVLETGKSAKAVAAEIEAGLPKRFKLDSELIKVLVLTAAQFKAVVADRPKGFGDEPGKYHSDAVFMVGRKVGDALKAFDPREGVDELWAGKGVIYHRRLSEKRTQTRLNKMMATPAYKSMTIRSWQTALKLAVMVGG